jgi:hypothetical protein
MKPFVRFVSQTTTNLFFVIIAVAMIPAASRAQNCQTSDDLDSATKTAIATAGQHFLSAAAKGDVATLRQNAIPTLAASFADIEAHVKERQGDLEGAQGTVKSVFLLEAAGDAPAAHLDFYCGVFGKSGQTANSAAFSLDNLPPGKYAVVLLDANSAKARTMFSEVLQQVGGDWKLAGLYIKPALAAGHDSDWFLARAREYKSKGQMHNAWFFYIEARSLIAPLPFMSTLATDKLYDESQAAKPADLPGGGKPVDLVVGALTYKLNQVFPDGVGNDLDLIVKYQSADAADGNKAYQDNVAVIKALITKYPELREAFAAVVARAEDANGHDYGTLLAMKDIK